MSPTVSSDQLRLFEGMLGEAFECFAQATPTVISVKSNGRGGEGAAGGFEVPFPWPKHEVGALAELGSAVAEALATGPVLVVPPWDQCADQGDQLSRYEHEIFLMNCAPNGRDSVLAVLTPGSTWTSRQAQPVREELARRWRPILLLYAAGVLPGIHPSFTLAAAFLRPAEAEESLLRIFQMPTRPDGPAVTEDFRRLLKRSGGRGKYGYVLRDMPIPGDSLAFDRHDPAVITKRAELAVLGSTVTVDQVFDIIRPGLHPVDDRDLLSDDAAPGASRIVMGRDLRRDGTLAPADESVQWALVPADRQLKPGDILLPRVFRATDSGGLRAVEVTDSDLRAAASDTVLTLRAKEPMTAPQRIITLGFLRSRHARDLAAAAADGGLHLTTSILKELQLPRPDEALSTALEDLAQAATLFEGWRTEAQAVLESAFTDDSPSVIRARIVNAGRSTRLRSDAAAQLDDAGYTFRTRLPYPVAYRWREVEAAVSARSFESAYRAILAAPEVLLCYAANLGLAVAHEAGIQLGAVKMIRDRLTSGGPGLGFGDWTSVLHEIRDSKTTRNVPDGNPIADIRLFLANRDTDAARQRLKERRDHESHLRRAESLDLPAAVEIALDDLTTLYQAASFLSDLPLMHVTSARWDEFKKLATVRYRELMGDHPVVPTRTITYDEPRIEEDSMYVMDGQRRLCLLRPFLSGSACPKCRNWSTFHIDRSVDGKIEYKSLEHGHPKEDALLDEALPYVGLLLLQIGLGSAAQLGLRHGPPASTTEIHRHGLSLGWHGPKPARWLLVTGIAAQPGRCSPRTCYRSHGGRAVLGHITPTRHHQTAEQATRAGR